MPLAPDHHVFCQHKVQKRRGLSAQTSTLGNGKKSYLVVYDYRAGFWGVMGHPCLGILPLSVDLAKLSDGSFQICLLPRHFTIIEKVKHGYGMRVPKVFA
ncbi:hypothetical protein B296_00000349 [Ensete ventricosum]|uniref:Uncharacterized protein n=1 Tax=Ensete ventricosum TaxID=4639 RepID=A0A427B2P5_ENSVE|nr:hypothetical protein B296_00000349 [Ensete ventricosum]